MLQNANLSHGLMRGIQQQVEFPRMLEAGERQESARHYRNERFLRPRPQRAHDIVPIPGSALRQSA